MKQIVIFLFAFIFPFVSFSQINGVFVSDFYLKNNTEKWCWSISQDDEDNMLFGVSKGVVVFDGVNQTFIKAPFTPLVMHFDSITHAIWIAGYEQIGVMKISTEGTYRYKKISEYDNEEFNSIKQRNDSLFIVSENSIIICSSQNEVAIDSIVLEDAYIDQAIDYRGKLYVIIDYFLHELRNGKLVEIVNVDFPVDEFSFGFELRNKIVLGTQENTFYAFNGRSFNEHEIRKSSFFENNLILDGASYTDSLIIASSLAGGIAIINIYTRKVIKQISYFNGLPDDEIRTLFVDKNKGIWVSHEFGISRIDLQTGLENYNYFPGLKGNPIAVSYFNNNLYVATNDGLFILDEIENFDEFEVNINVPVNVTIEVPVKRKSSIKEENTTDKKAKTRRQRRKEKKNDDNEDVKENEASKSKTKKKTVRRIQKRTIKKRSLKSISHYYKLVEGMTGKYRQLIPYNNYMLAAGNNGLYAVADKKSELIIDNVYVNNVFFENTMKEAYCCTNNGLYKIYNDDGDWKFVHFYETTNENIYSITHEKDNIWSMVFDNKIVRAKLTDNEIKIIHEADIPEEPGRIFFVKSINDSVNIFTSQYIYWLSKNGELQVKEELPNDAFIINNQAKCNWVFKDNEWDFVTTNGQKLGSNMINTIKLSDKIRYIDVNSDGSIWLINEQNHISKIQQGAKGSINDFSLKIKEIRSGNKVFDISKSIDLPADMNTLDLKLSAPFYLMQNGVLFSYKVNGFDNDWSDWTSNSILSIKYLPPGDYTISCKAKNSFGEIVKTKTVLVKIAKPFTQTLAFYLLIVVLFIVFAILFSKYRLKKLEKDKRVLEKKVQERTQTIVIQKDKIEKQNVEITQSIRYAQRIQNAMLPHEEIIDAMLPKHFILFLPRDIVSGDFYFFKLLGNYIVFIAADCTGHGVPGGFMSMLGISYLSEITSQLSKDTTAAEVINHLRDKIKLTLGQTSIEATQKDGMDLTICLIDTTSKKIQFAGAFNPLYIIRDNELVTIKGDKQPVSVYYNEIEFTNHEIDIQEGDKFYMFSDGFQDQFGGPKGRKYMTKNFKKLLMDNHQKPMIEQKEILHNAITTWKGDLMQVDDILVVGFEV